MFPFVLFGVSVSGRLPCVQPSHASILVYVRLFPAKSLERAAGARIRVVGAVIIVSPKPSWNSGDGRWNVRNAQQGQGVPRPPRPVRSRGRFCSGHWFVPSVVPPSLDYLWLHRNAQIYQRLYICDEKTQRNAVVTRTYLKALERSMTLKRSYVMNYILLYQIPIRIKPSIMWDRRLVLAVPH